MDDRIIDLTSYAGGGERGGGSFALWGAEGERSRFALPVWRSIFILGGDRGALVWTQGGDEEGSARPFFVLDLGREPARTTFDDLPTGELADRDAPAFAVVAGVGLVLLGREEGRTWWLVVTGPEVESSAADEGAREDLLFLAGECAGLLTRRGLADEAGDEDDEDG